MASSNHNMWQALKRICDYHSLSRNGPNSEEFVYHFSRLFVPNSVDYLDEGFENMTIDFINKFHSPVQTMVSCEWDSITLNANFAIDEIGAAINYTKCKKSLGVDNIPVELVKACKELANDLVDVFTIYSTFRIDWLRVYGLLFIKFDRRDLSMIFVASLYYYLQKRFLKSWYISEYCFWTRLLINTSGMVAT